MKKRRNISNSWDSPAPRADTPIRLQRALRSRQACEGRVPGHTGTHIPRYFESLRQFKRFIRRRLKNGSNDLIASLREAGSVYVRKPGRRDWDQFTAQQVIDEFCPSQDTSHHHLACNEEDQCAQKTLEPLPAEASLKPCSRSCGTWTSGGQPCSVCLNQKGQNSKPAPNTLKSATDPLAIQPNRGRTPSEPGEVSSRWSS